MLQNAYLDAKIGVDPAENEPRIASDGVAARPIAVALPAAKSFRFCAFSAVPRAGRANGVPHRRGRLRDNADSESIFKMNVRGTSKIVH